MSTASNILLSNLQACRQRITKLAYSVEKNAALFPITSENAQTFTEEQEEAIDAMILRYAQCVSMIQDHIFRGIALLEQEDISDKSSPFKVPFLYKSTTYAAKRCLTKIFHNNSIINPKKYHTK